jgi:2-C-methyl-D-erythritol 2,4-cyclodiphosphate synthase
VAELLQVATNCVGIKAKTPEGTGTDNAAIAHAVVLLESIPLEPMLEADAVAVGVETVEAEEVAKIIDGNGNGRH